MQKQKLNRFFIGQAIILIAHLLFFFLIKNSPLVGTLGIEAANLLIGIFGPLYFFAALFFSDKHSRSTRDHCIFWFGALTIQITLLGGALYLNSFQVQSCSEGFGLVPFLLIFLPPASLNIFLGLLFAQIFVKNLTKILFFFIVQIAYFLLVGFFWWKEPSFRLFSHLSLVINSDLLNGSELESSLIIFRLSTAIFTAIVVVLLNSFWDQPQSYFYNLKVQKPLWNISILGILLCSGIALDRYAKSIDGQSNQQLDQAYSLRLESNNITLRANPKHISKLDAKKVLQDALFWHSRIQKQLNAVDHSKITIWLHEDESQKALYTGAKNVHFALPRHGQIHIANPKVPHPILGHEIAHVLLAPFSKTFLGVPGEWQIFPNFALTEGIAVELTKELNISFGLTLEQKAKALFQSGIKPNFSKLFSTLSAEFYSTSPRVSYIYSGAVVSFYLNRSSKSDRPQKIKELSLAGSLKKVFNNSDDYEQFLEDFENELSKDLPTFALSWARKNFQQKSILQRNCLPNPNDPLDQLEVAWLNLDLKSSIAALEKLPIKQRADAVNSFEKKIFNKSSLDFYCQLKDVSPKQFIADNFAKNQEGNSLFLQTKCLLNSGNFNEVLAELKSYDQQVLLPAQHRVFVALKFLLEEQIAKPSVLALATLNYLMASDFQRRDASMEFLKQFYLDQSQKEKQRPHLYWLANYLAARYEFNNRDWQSSLRLVSKGLVQSNYLPKPFVNQMHLLNTIIFLELGFHDAAILALEYLEKQNLSDAQKSHVSLQKERTTFNKTQLTISE